MRYLLLLICCAVLLVNFGATQSPAPTPGSPTSLGTLPATYGGVLPCADCPGIRYTLNLFSNHVYFLRMSYQERNAQNDEIGRWTQSHDGKTLRLDTGGHVTSFRILDPSTLEQLDQAGKPIASELNYKLTRAAAFEPFEPKISPKE